MAMFIIHVILDERENEVYEFVPGIVDDDAVWLSFFFQSDVVVVVYAIFPDSPFSRLCEVGFE